jgi:hypothetical protein
MQSKRSNKESAPRFNGSALKPHFCGMLLGSFLTALLRSSVCLIIFWAIQAGLSSPALAQVPTLQSPPSLNASVGELVSFDLSVLGLQQAAAAGTRYDGLRFAVSALGSLSIESGALDSTTGRFRWTVPCADVGRTLPLQFKLYNSGVLLATSMTNLVLSREVPPISASYPDLVLLNADMATTIELTAKSPCGSTARLEALPNPYGIVVATSGTYPEFRVSLTAKSALAEKDLTLKFKLSDGGTSQVIALKAIVDNAPRPPYFERDLPKRIELYEDETRPVRIRAFDPNEGDKITYTIKNETDLKGQILGINSEEGIITWKSKADAFDPDKDRADYEIVVEARDPQRQSVTETFRVTVLRKVTITQRQQRLRRYADEYKRLEALREEAISFYTVVNRRADKRSAGELYRILGKSMFSILAAVSATIVHEQTRVIAVSSATVLVAGVDLVSNRRRKYDPFEDLKAVRELIKSITVALSDRKYKYNDVELGDLTRLSLKDDILAITRDLATDCDKFAIELRLLNDRYKQTVQPFGIK